MEYLSKSEEQTYKIAKEIASSAKTGDVYALFGDLGSGKTTFAKGFGFALGINKPITSPTFVIQKEYPVTVGRVKRLIHVDCYRLTSPEDIESIGLMEHFENKDEVVLLEWPEKIKGFLPCNAKEIYFDYLGENERKITIKT